MKLKLAVMIILPSICFAKGLDPDVIRKILMSEVPKMSKCYKDELKRSGEEFAFSPILHFKINSFGGVESSSVETIKADPESKTVRSVSECVNNVLKSIKFPKPTGGGLVEVNQPLNFRPNTKGKK